MAELLLTALRAALVYAALLLVVRLLGKRTIGNLNAFDLIVALIISEIVDGPIYGDVPLAQALIALAALALLHYANAWLSARNCWVDRFLGGSPRVLIRDGQIVYRALLRENINVDELWGLLRQQGIDRLEDVRLGTLETEGVLSVLLSDPAQPAQKRDLPKT
jgi:uncharacterized membrane protein YcaP (DUF421 family)